MLKYYSRFYAATCIQCANAIHFLPAFVKPVTLLWPILSR